MKMSDENSFIVLILVFLIVISISSYLLINFYADVQKNPVTKILEEENYCALHAKDTVLSFEIDDITFSGFQKPALENALFLAEKYDITFDLGVIAKTFNETMDTNNVNIYQDNKNYFEVIAHGFTHGLDQSIIDEYPKNDVYGEFYVFSVNSSVPSDIQEYHIKSMKQVFEEYNLTTAIQIFTVPYHTGDFNTTLLAAKYGYKLIIQKITTPQAFSEVKFGNITDTQNYIDIPLEFNRITQDEITNYTSQLNRAIKAGQRRIDISLHPLNFNNLGDIDSFFNQTLTSIRENNPNVRFDFLSDRFKC